MTLSTTRAAFLAASAAFAGGGCDDGSCFVRGTKVRTPSGDRFIEDLVVGDRVLAWDGAAVVERAVLACHERVADEVFSLRAGDVVIAGVTGEHPFWDDVLMAWRPLRSLTLASRLAVLHEGRLHPVAVVELRRAGGAATVFNLSVSAPEQNYFVEGALVHNKTPSRDCIEDVDCADDETCDNDAAICVPSCVEADCAEGASCSADSNACEADPADV